MKRHFYFLLLLVSVFMISCQKEVSIETGALPGDSTITGPIGNTCQLGSISESDSASGVGTYAFNTSFNTAHKAVNLDIVDSVRNVIDGSFAITYPTGRIQLDARQYFVVGTDGRITEFHGYQYPEYNQGDKVSVKYTYNAAGQLTLRTYAYDSIPNTVLLQMKFTYAGGNLTNQLVEANTGPSFLKVGEVVYSYDASKTIKEALHMQALSPEITSFQTIVNAGTRSVNPVTRIVVTEIDPFTRVVSTSVSNVLNYLIDTRGYVQSFNVAGDDFDYGGLYAKRKYRLSYSCY